MARTTRANPPEPPDDPEIVDGEIVDESEVTKNENVVVVEERRSFLTLGRIAAALVAVIALILVISWWNSDDNVDPVASADVGTTSDTGSNATLCPERFTQNLDPNEDFRFVSEGFSGTAEQKRRQLIKAVGEDYRYLDFMGEQLFSKKFQETSLVSSDEGCLSEKGQRLFMKVKSALMASTVKNGMAPADSFNTGMSDGQAVVAEERGISGNRKATVYTLPDGSKLIVMDRCGNVALPDNPPSIPDGPTDNPPPVDQPNPKCPPGQVGTPPNCLEPKNPDDHPANNGNGPPDPWDPAPPVTEPASPPAGGEPPEEYVPPAPPPVDEEEQAPGSTPTPEPTSPPVVVDETVDHSTDPPPPPDW